MGLYEDTLPCGCVECTSTLSIPPETFIIKYCDKHKPKKVSQEKSDDKLNYKSKSELNK